MSFFIKQNTLRIFLSHFLRRIINRVDNLGNSCPETNGEFCFVDEILSIFKDEEFVFFDVGANIGKYSDYLLRNVQSKKYQFHLFEPQQSCYKILADKFKSEKILINNFGLSSKKINSEIYKDIESSGLASFYNRDLTFYNMSLSIKETVDLIQGIEYVKTNNINHINFIKIDVEGHELEVLKGFGDFLDIKNVDFIQLEYGGSNLDSKTNLRDLFFFLKQKGFQILKLMRKNAEILTYTPDHENFLNQNIIAVAPRIFDKYAKK